MIKQIPITIDFDQKKIVGYIGIFDEDIEYEIINKTFKKEPLKLYGAVVVDKTINENQPKNHELHSVSILKEVTTLSPKKTEIIRELKRMKRETGYIGNGLDLVKKEYQDKVLDEAIKIIEKKND